MMVRRRSNKVTKIGTEGTQKKTFIAGVYSNTAVSGWLSSSDQRRTRGGIVLRTIQDRHCADGGENRKAPTVTTGDLPLQGRPTGHWRYGLIAEEVAKVYPELVVRDDQGRDRRLKVSKDECVIEPVWLHAQEETPLFLTDAAFASFVELGRRGTGHKVNPKRVELKRERKRPGSTKLISRARSNSERAGMRSSCTRPILIGRSLPTTPSCLTC